jgi:hypothetical protein
VLARGARGALRLERAIERAVYGMTQTKRLRTNSRRCDRTRSLLESFWFPRMAGSRTRALSRIGPCRAPRGRCPCDRPPRSCAEWRSRSPCSALVTVRALRALRAREPAILGGPENIISRHDPPVRSRAGARRPRTLSSSRLGKRRQADTANTRRSSPRTRAPLRASQSKKRSNTPPHHNRTHDPTCRSIIEPVPAGTALLRSNARPPASHRVRRRSSPSWD